MIQTDLNELWDRWQESGDHAEGLLHRRGKQHDVLVDLRESRVWSRSHETGIWTEAMPLASTSAFPSNHSRIERGGEPSGLKAARVQPTFDGR